MNSSDDFSLPNATGFASPAQDYSAKQLDIADYLICNQQATYYMRISGDAMSEMGIDDGDLLVVDRQRHIKAADIVVAVVADEMLVRQYQPSKTGLMLVAANPHYAPLFITAEAQIWGRVMHVVKSF